MNATLEILEASRQEVKNIIKDIQQNSDHANMYNLMGIYEDIRRLEVETEYILDNKIEQKLLENLINDAIIAYEEEIVNMPSFNQLKNKEEILLTEIARYIPRNKLECIECLEECILEQKVILERGFLQKGMRLASYIR